MRRPLVLALVLVLVLAPRRSHAETAGLKIDDTGHLLRSFTIPTGKTITLAPGSIIQGTGLSIGPNGLTTPVIGGPDSVSIYIGSAEDSEPTLSFFDVTTPIVQPEGGDAQYALANLGLLKNPAATTVAHGGTNLTTFSGPNRLLYSATASQASTLATAANGVLVTNSSGVPSISTTLPAVDGSAVTNLSASNLSSGTVPNARLDSDLASIAALSTTSLGRGLLTSDSQSFVEESGKVSAVNSQNLGPSLATPFLSVNSTTLTFGNYSSVNFPEDTGQLFREGLGLGEGNDVVFNRISIDDDSVGFGILIRDDTTGLIRAGVPNVDVLYPDGDGSGLTNLPPTRDFSTWSARGGADDLLAPAVRFAVQSAASGIGGVFRGSETGTGSFPLAIDVPNGPGVKISQSGQYTALSALYVRRNHGMAYASPLITLLVNEDTPTAPLLSIRNGPEAIDAELVEQNPPIAIIQARGDISAPHSGGQGTSESLGALTVGPAMGSGADVLFFRASDVGGVVTMDPPTGGGSTGILFSVTFHRAFAAAPAVVVSATTDAAAKTLPYVETTITGFDVYAGGGTPAPAFGFRQGFSWHITDLDH